MIYEYKVVDMMRVEPGVSTEARAEKVLNELALIDLMEASLKTALEDKR